MRPKNLKPLPKAGRTIVTIKVRVAGGSAHTSKNRVEKKKFARFLSLNTVFFLAAYSKRFTLH